VPHVTASAENADPEHSSAPPHPIDIAIVASIQPMANGFRMRSQ
jgi:hypothetical protein